MSVVDFDRLKVGVSRHLRAAKLEALTRALPGDFAIWRGRRTSGRIAPTFDDGPDDQHTLPLLETLEALGVRATFFLVGERVERYPKIVAAVAEAGHEIGNHSFGHNDYQVGPLKNVAEELQRTNDAITKITGVRPRLFRPPYGALSPEILWAAFRARMQVVLWSFDSLDHTGAPPPEASLTQTHAGDIVLMHDDNAVSNEILKDQAPVLDNRGLQLCTVSDLLAR